ncbi:hypothetical protein [Asanoa iriomotensis]|uniref:Uncharacterized protein n=1 Tax=Asanoa iriomotensis TaxID=234613 RepID=A0ABQ4BWI4_9ACTN|nr:hypothetical protein [Asanoa iriomotensis]GIF54898.1 hypothetical protein Air01nite_09930 [Asanoa iriomotensis]
MQETARLAGFFAAHGIWSVADGGTLTPLLGYERADGERGMVRFANEDVGAGAQIGRQALRDNRNGAVRAVLVVDAYLHLHAGKVDALVAEAVDYGPPSRTFTIGVPYRPQGSPGGFAVHRPKLLQDPGAEATALIEAFFAGVDAHEPAAQVWNASLDESI